MAEDASSRFFTSRHRLSCGKHHSGAPFRTTGGESIRYCENFLLISETFHRLTPYSLGTEGRRGLDESCRKYSLCLAAVPAVASVYGRGCTDLSLGNRGNHRDFHADSCGDAAVAAGL